MKPILEEIATIPSPRWLKLCSAKTCIPLVHMYTCLPAVTHAEITSSSAESDIIYHCERAVVLVNGAVVNHRSFIMYMRRSRTSRLPLRFALSACCSNACNATNRTHFSLCVYKYMWLFASAACCYCAPAGRWKRVCGRLLHQSG